MSLKLATALLLGMAVTSSPALACMGPALYLSDNFQIMDPAWFLYPLQLLSSGMTPPVTKLTVGGGYADLTPPVGAYVVADYGGNFFDNNDVCVDIVSPTVADPTQAAAGISFGMTTAGYYVFAAEEDGQAALIQYQFGLFGTSTWRFVVPWRTAPALKTGGNATNTLRVTWNGTSGIGAAYINGQEFTTFTTAAFLNSLFGLWCQGDPGVNPTTGAPWRFANLKITNVAP